MKTKTYKKGAIVGLAIVMLFSLVALGGCGRTRLECICDEDCYGACNFEFVIDIEEVIISQATGSYFTVNLKLYNRSGQEVGIVGYSAFVAPRTHINWGYGPLVDHVRCGRIVPSRSIPITYRLADGEYRFIIFKISYRKSDPYNPYTIPLMFPLPIGTHDLEFSATLFIGSNRFNGYSKRIDSNTVQITVIEGENTND